MMEALGSLGQSVLDTLVQAAHSAAALLPQILAAGLLIVVGVFVARGIRVLVVRVAGGVETFSSALGLDQALGTARMRTSVTEIIGTVAYWITILLFVTFAMNVLGLELFTSWLDQIVAYLPHFFAGVIIILAGIVIANVTRDAVLALSQSLPDRQRSALGRAAQIMMLVIMVVVGADQIGIDVTLVSTMIAVIGAAFLGGLAIAFGFGARTLVGNLMGMRYLDDDYRIGERVRVGQHEGTIAELNSTTVVIATEEGRVTVPGKIFSEESTVLLGTERADG